LPATIPIAFLGFAPFGHSRTFMPLPSCLIIVENLPVPFDRRVWQEALALAEAGWQVSVLCPQSPLHPQQEEVIDGIFIYRHPPLPEARGRFSFVFEYATALFHETRLTWKIFRRHGIHVIHACNPPDLIFLVAMPFKLLGVKFVFDHHDICPELYTAKFRRRGIGYWAMRLFEMLSYRCADQVITANDSFKKLCGPRTRKRLNDITVVRSFPDPDKFTLVPPDPISLTGPRFVIGYIGVIGDQDGVDMLVRAISVLRRRSRDFEFVCRIVGDGPSCDSVKALARASNLGDLVEFTGYLRGHDLLKTLSSFDIGVIPDPKNSYTDNITMNKVFEYMFLAKPVVAFQLRETMDLLGNCAVFAEKETPEALADAIFLLMDNRTLRIKLGEAGYRRARELFSWPSEAKKLVEAYDNLRPERSHGQGIAVSR
jgi:glycosyltransferase involved in cell wall biosynthesis